MARKSCSACGVIIPRAFDEVRCIECQAKAMPARKYSIEEEAILSRLWRREKVASVQIAIFKATGRPRRYQCLVSKAARMGLDHHQHDGEFTLREVADLLELKVSHVAKMHCNGQIKSIGRGKCMLVPLEEVDRLMKLFPAPPLRSVTIKEACRRLGYGSTYVIELIQAGELVGVKRGRPWFICEESLEKRIAEMKATRAINWRWKCEKRHRERRDKQNREDRRRRSLRRNPLVAS